MRCQDLFDLLASRSASIPQDKGGLGASGRKIRQFQAATLNSAQALGRERELGQVAPGYFADIVILEADPLAEIGNAGRIDLVMKAGKVYKPADLTRGLGVRH